MKQSQPPCIVLGRSPTALYVIRELGQADIPLCSEGKTSHTANWSKFLTHTPSTLEATTDKERVNNLLKSVSSTTADKAYLIASSDQDIAFIIRNSDTLSEAFHIQHSYKNGLAEKIMDKEFLYDLCIKHDVPVPGSWTKNKNELLNLQQQLNFPCLIKPSLIHEVKTYMAGKKLWVAKTSKDFESIISKLPTGKTNWLVQEIIPGPESEIWLYAAYFDVNSNSHQAFTARKLRQFPPGFGSASMVRSEDNPELKELCESFFKKISYQGIAAAELKRDPKDNQLKMIEINPRPSLWFGLSTSAEKHISLATYNDALGTNFPKESPQLNNVYWRYLFKDMYSAVFYYINKGFILPAPNLSNSSKVQKHVWAVFSTDDFKPALGELHYFLRKLILRIIKRSTKK